MSRERRLFGTDGVRGTANVEPMTSETALRLGRALAHVSKRSPHRHKILIGKDTRLSGYMLETAMASGHLLDGRSTCCWSARCRHRASPSSSRAPCGPMPGW